MQLREMPVHQPNDPGQAAKRALDVMKTAHDEVTLSEPFLPFSDSVLPALLALRKTHSTIAESKAYLTTQGASLGEAKRRLEAERAGLNDQTALTTALEDRIQALRHGLETKMDMTAEQVVKEKLDELRREKRDYDRETARLVKALNGFIAGHLGPMLAAEELGGPVVGDMIDIEPDNLAAGFNAHGKPKKPKAAANVDRRQRRIDDIWGGGGEEHRREAGRGSGDWDEAKAAGAEMRELTEMLLNSLVEAGGDSSAAYIDVARESAAARFLVRSKVAQFHPRDATKLRLVDFGRELDD